MNMEQWVGEGAAAGINLLYYSPILSAVLFDSKKKKEGRERIINLAQRHAWQSWKGLSFSSFWTIPEPFQNGWCSITPSVVPATSHNPSGRTSPRGLRALETMNEDLKNGCTSHLPWVQNPFAPKDSSQTLRGHCCVRRLTCTDHLCRTPQRPGKRRALGQIWLGWAVSF